MSLFGLLNINKPSGMSSRRVVDRVLRLVRPAKAGHTGTLDPLASGVLVVCVGAATRLVEYVQRMPKRYTATFVLGRESPTEDIEGEVTLLEDAPEPSLEAIRQAADVWTGEVEQRPPAFSALKVGGRRAYKLARAGREVELEPRKVTIHAIEVVEYEYPRLVLDVRCGGGTYIRSLGRDMARACGTAAVMSGLMRTAVGSFRLDEAIELESLAADHLDEHLLPAIRAVETLPTIELTAEEIDRTGRGLSIDRAAPAGAEEVAAVDGGGQLIALLASRDGGLGPLRNFPQLD